MNTKQELHLANLKEKVIERLGVKYRAGAKEHNSDLIDMPLEKLIKNGIDEAIDSFVYLQTALDKLENK